MENVFVKQFLRAYACFLTQNYPQSFFLEVSPVFLIVAPIVLLATAACCKWSTHRAGAWGAKPGKHSFMQGRFT